MSEQQFTINAVTVETDGVSCTFGTPSRLNITTVEESTGDAVTLRYRHGGRSVLRSTFGGAAERAAHRARVSREAIERGDPDPMHATMYTRTLYANTLPVLLEDAAAATEEIEHANVPRLSMMAVIDVRVTHLQSGEWCAVLYLARRGTHDGG